MSPTMGAIATIQPTAPMLYIEWLPYGDRFLVLTSDLLSVYSWNCSLLWKYCYMDFNTRTRAIIDLASWTLDGKYIVTAYTGSAWASLLLTGPSITLLVVGGELLHVSQVHEPLSRTPVEIVFILVMIVAAVASIILVIRMNIK